MTGELHNSEGAQATAEPNYFRITLSDGLPPESANPVVADAGSFRIVFVTDIHIQRERRAEERVAACLSSIRNLQVRPSLVINGGDIVMDAVAAERERVDLLWDMWEKGARKLDGIPMHYCIGNHDIWGWSRKAVCSEDDPLFGKAMMMRRVGMPGAYYTFDAGGWRFIVLDSVQRVDANRYIARIDGDQRTWLEQTLAATPGETPVAVLSHIPILGGASVLFANSDSKPPGGGAAEPRGDLVVPRWQMHADAVDLIELFCASKNVRLCLSGHTHVFDTLIYRNIAFVNGGAACGQWWRGEFFGTPPGYCIIDLALNGQGMGISYVPFD